MAHHEGIWKILNLFKAKKIRRSNPASVSLSVSFPFPLVIRSFCCSLSTELQQRDVCDNQAKVIYNTRVLFIVTHTHTHMFYNPSQHMISSAGFSPTFHVHIRCYRSTWCRCSKTYLSVHAFVYTHTHIHTLIYTRS